MGETHKTLSWTLKTQQVLIGPHVKGGRQGKEAPRLQGTTGRAHVGCRAVSFRKTVQES